ncbi:YwiC-like family protein [Sporolactobacillus sp. CQH2019]|uniref:YwiC-like family protein n=1 Tax=Sporolactobacillus sp. CQH2019 TaxID=3023512 RepID=UPI0023689259|nr:YwiC-like family protein [Sporolactobacillus sp. CQH2019]MDD9149591.1 YwiC-like family protein [Sporolactobacillus sp. CQH2019]
MMKLSVPKQHGAWAMLFVPYWLEASAAHFTWPQFVTFFAWVSLYLSVYTGFSLLKTNNQTKKKQYKQSFLIYSAIAFVLIVCSLLSNWLILLVGCCMLPFFCINIYYAKRKNERSLVNDIAAVCIFSIGGLAACLSANSSIDRQALEIAVLNVLFFVGTALYVKTMIRKRKSLSYHYLSWIYHFLMVLLPVLGGNFLIALAFFPGLLRSLIMYGKSVKILTIGIIEIINAAFFFIILLIAIHA